MPATFVQAQSAATVGGTSVTTAALTTTSGNLFTVIGGSYGGTTFSSPPITDSKSNTYVEAHTQNTTGGTDIIHWYKENGTGGASHTFTCSISASSDVSVAAGETNVIATSGSLDKTAQGGEAVNTTTHSSDATAATAQANEMLIGGFATGDNAGSPLTGTNSWTVPTNGYVDSGGIDLGILWKYVTSTGAYDCTCTSNVACRSAMSIGTYKEAAAGGGAASDCDRGIYRGLARGYARGLG